MHYAATIGLTKAGIIGHLHAFEETFFVREGQLILLIEDRA